MILTPMTAITFIQTINYSVEWWIGVFQLLLLYSSGFFVSPDGIDIKTLPLFLSIVRMLV